VDRAAIARRVFHDPQQRRRLEGLLHPWVNDRRRALQERADPSTVAFIWDTPLLFETGLNRQCDAVVFVEAPESERQRRVADQRGWDAAEWRGRENLQMPLDKKKEISDHVIVNTARGAAETDAPACDARSQVREILSRIVAGLPPRPDRA
jgi:dephospho-CoA kinase